MPYTVCKVFFCSILCTVCLELQVSKKYSSITFEHVPPTATCHRVEGQGTGWSKTVQELCRSIPETTCALLGQPDSIATVKCHYNACHYNANASLTRSILGSQTAPTLWHALMTVPEWLSTWAKGVKSSRSDRPQRQWHLFVPIQMEQNKRIPPAGHLNTVDSWLIFDQTHWLFISDALRMPQFGQYGC